MLGGRALEEVVRPTADPFTFRVPAEVAGGSELELIPYHRIAHELLWWIRPEARGSKLGIQLLQAFEHWAKTIGCTHVQMSMVNNTHLDRVAKLYTRTGYALAEQVFLKEVI